MKCCINRAAAIFKFAGAVSLAEAELKTQTWYFVFQVIQVFIVVTLSSGALAVIQQITNNPSSAATLLAEELPTASNFFINYLILQGLAIASSTLFNVGALAMLLFVGKYLDKTPRKMYNRYTNLAGLQLGSQYPKFTNLAVIGKLSMVRSICDFRATHYLNSDYVLLHRPVNTGLRRCRFVLVIPRLPLQSVLCNGHAQHQHARPRIRQSASATHYWSVPGRSMSHWSLRH